MNGDSCVKHAWLLWLTYSCALLLIHNGHESKDKDFLQMEIQHQYCLIRTSVIYAL